MKKTKLTKNNRLTVRTEAIRLLQGRDITGLAGVAGGVDVGTCDSGGTCGRGKGGGTGGPKPQ